MNEITVHNEETLGIDPQILSKLATYEDFLSYYIQLSQAHDSVSWVKADLLLQMQKKLGEGGLVQLSKELRQPASTVSTYIRAAKAFPLDKRDPALSFTIHLHASYADSYDDKKGVFWGEERFRWLEQAADGAWSSRKLLAEIQDKKTDPKKTVSKPCVKCTTTEIKTRQYVLYAPGAGTRSKKFWMDEGCLMKLLTWIYGDPTTERPVSQQDNSGNK